ncbi:MAG: phosphoglycolate phosphatase [Thaumarchaeota archaeon]|nr:phosphoglycolate phosphatase [Nitrososphaerota archaeon]|tara:strand:+ start:1329 stop:2051 length:723 start_codon:yes stop_codon:yes gene_type:complete
MKVKVLAVDIDGTLTENDNGVVHLGSLSMLRTIESMGCKVIYVTGRSSIEAYILSVFGGTTRIAVGENGGVITTSPHEHRFLVDRSHSEKAYEFLRSRIDNVKIKIIFPRMTEVVLERTFDMIVAAQMLKENNLPVIIADSKFAYHLNHESINKSVGFKVVLTMLGIKPEESIAIGDSETDVSLFNICGYSIALGNAETDVKASAKHSVNKNFGNGLVEALDHIAQNFLGVKNDIQIFDK